MPAVPETLADYVDTRDDGLILHLPRRLFVRRAALWLILPLPLWGIAAAWWLLGGDSATVRTALLAFVSLGSAMSWLVGIASLALSKKLVQATRVGIDVLNHQVISSQLPEPVPFAAIRAVEVGPTAPGSSVWSVLARTEAGPPCVLLPQIPAREADAATQLADACAQLIGVEVEPREG